jgi:hypothetical protein
MAENPRRSAGMLSEKGRFCLRICGGSLKLGVGWKGIRGLGERGKSGLAHHRMCGHHRQIERLENLRWQDFVSPGNRLISVHHNVWCSTLYPTGILHC